MLPSAPIQNAPVSDQSLTQLLPQAMELWPIHHNCRVFLFHRDTLSRWRPKSKSHNIYPLSPQDVLKVNPLGDLHWVHCQLDSIRVPEAMASVAASVETDWNTVRLREKVQLHQQIRQRIPMRKMPVWRKSQAPVELMNNLQPRGRKILLKTQRKLVEKEELNWKT